MANNTTAPMSDDILEQNCRPDWPRWTCIAANVCGLTSTTLWFLVLLPQVYKNFLRKSVLGLSILWATANFTASLINLFFVFMYASLPLYTTINSVYMPVLEFTILVQFWIYNVQYSNRAKYMYTAFCLVLWGTIITVQLAARRFPQVQWVAIGLWCIETFPQILLNMKLRSTSGQSTRSVVIAMIGKMTDFLSNYGLVIPIQYVVMTYFSSSIAYINSIQVVWYYRREKSSDQEDPQMGTSASFMASTESMEYTPLCSKIIVRWRTRSTIKFVVKGILITVQICILVLFLYGLIAVTDSPYSVMAPVGISLVLATAYVYYSTAICRKRSSAQISYTM